VPKTNEFSEKGWSKSLCSAKYWCCFSAAHKSCSAKYWCCFTTLSADVSQRALLSGIPVSGSWSFGKQGTLCIISDMFVHCFDGN